MSHHKDEVKERGKRAIREVINWLYETRTMTIVEIQDLLDEAHREVVYDK